GGRGGGQRYLDQVVIARRGMRRGGRLREGQRGAEEQDSTNRGREKPHEILPSPLGSRGAKWRSRMTGPPRLRWGRLPRRDRAHPGAARDSKTCVSQCPPCRPREAYQTQWLAQSVSAPAAWRGT